MPAWSAGCTSFDTSEGGVDHERPIAMLKPIGIILIVIGILALVIPSISFTKREKVVDLGPIQATAEKKETIPLSPILGVSALAVGAMLLVIKTTKKT